MKTLLLVAVVACGLLGFCQLSRGQVTEKRPSVEATLGKPFHETKNSFMRTTCSYNSNGWKIALTYVGEVCARAVYVKADETPLTDEQITAILQRNSEGHQWHVQPGGDSDVHKFIREDGFYTASVVFGRVLDIENPEFEKRFKDAGL